MPPCSTLEMGAISVCFRQKQCFGGICRCCVSLLGEGGQGISSPLLEADSEWKAKAHVYPAIASNRKDNIIM